MIVDPVEIEKLSFKIIEERLNGHKIDSSNIDTIKRIIHTTADFDYADITEISLNAIKSGINAIKNKCKIYADTRMIIAGINKRLLGKYGSEVYTYIDDQEVIDIAKKKNITRSIAGIEKAILDKDTKIFVIGNAPTALLTLKKYIELGKVKPDLIIGVPVGFVGAKESKEEIKKVNIPYIVTNGEKGGSTIAVAIVNSILLKIEK